ncbi:hypothetical protein KAR91_30750 [Candidatus Pacearchaeota archaeon]|nr:hypothetical protein [Candidatus Pacearchaeota archaeon]
MKLSYTNEADIPADVKASYQQKGEGWELSQTALDAIIGDSKTKVSEFRNTNINLMKSNEELTAKVKTFDGLDMDSINKAKQDSSAKDTELSQLQKNFDVLNLRFDKQEQELASSKKQNEMTVIEKSVFGALDKLGTLKKGSNQYIMHDSLKGFAVKDGVVKHTNPLDGLEQSAESWAKSKYEAGDFNFFKENSTGSGAQGGKEQNSNGVMTADKIAQLAKGESV